VRPRGFEPLTYGFVDLLGLLQESTRSESIDSGRKGLLTNEEALGEIKAVRREMEGKRGC
jgi:hypothetical protein